MAVIGRISKEVMDMLGFGSKKVEENNSSCCACDCGGETTLCNKSDDTTVRVLGIGCSNCKLVEENIKEALRQMGKSAVVEKVTDMAEITSYGVMGLPAIAIGRKVISSGKVLNTEEIIKLFQKLEK
ncbi:MAG: thioredoxin family protein [Synergistaceae bacterium]|nr:thioredoxin family protein [Synergistaceae bacterium]